VAFQLPAVSVISFFITGVLENNQRAIACVSIGVEESAPERRPDVRHEPEACRGSLFDCLHDRDVKTQSAFKIDRCVMPSSCSGYGA
jgi:hypothetical protein